MPFISSIKPDATYPVDLWIDEKTAIPAQIHVTEPDNNGWQIEIFGINDPVDIPTPQLLRPCQASSLNVASAAAPAA